MIQRLVDMVQSSQDEDVSLKHADSPRIGGYILLTSEDSSIYKK